MSGEVSFNDEGLTGTGRTVTISRRGEVVRLFFGKRTAGDQQQHPIRQKEHERAIVTQLTMQLPPELHGGAGSALR